MTTSSDDADNATRQPQPGPHNGLASGRTFEVAIDANDPAQLRAFWITALNYVEHVTDEGAVDLVDPAGRDPTIWFQQVPEGNPDEPRTGLHLDRITTLGTRG
jgi:hypothetical protein